LQQQKKNHCNNQKSFVATFKISHSNNNDEAGGGGRRRGRSQIQRRRG
jgi:hypothetical protein